MYYNTKLITCQSLNINMIKPCSVVYFPGTGGNFIKLCLSLSPETVPYYTKDLNKCNDEEILKIQSMTSAERQQIVQIDNLDNFKKFHITRNSVTDILHVDFYYKNPLINNYFEWAIIANHLDNYYDRLPWLKKIIYIELDWNKHASWVRNAGAYFKNFSYISNFIINQDNNNIPNIQQHNQVCELINNQLTTTISMSKILDSTDGFVEQYLLACESIGISPVIEQAVDLYRRWHKFRVEPFI